MHAYMYIYIHAHIDTYIYMYIHTHTYTSYKNIQIYGCICVQKHLKVASQEERPLKWKEHFKYLLGNPSEITNKPTEKKS